MHLDPYQQNEENRATGQGRHGDLIKDYMQALY